MAEELGDPASPNRPRATPHVPELDGVRGLAVFCILICHYASIPESANPILSAMHITVSGAWMGVELFFVLSGFLITGILLDSPRDRDSVRGFYVRRGLRIVPLYYLTLIIAFVILPRLLPFNAPEDRSLLRSQGWAWAYLVNVGAVLGGSVNFVGSWIWLGHFWSLAIENHFYLVWPLLVWVLSRASLARACLGVLIVSPLIRTALLWSSLPRLASYELTPLRLDPLVAGALLALAVRRVESLESLRKPALVGLVTGIAGLAGLAAWRRNLDFEDPMMQAIGFSLTTLASGGLLTASISMAPGSLLRRAMRLGVMRSLGKYSYGIYVFHGLMKPSFERVFATRRLMAWVPSYVLAGFIHFTLAFIVSFALAFASWHLFEKHFLHLKEILAPRRMRGESAARLA